MLGCYLHGILLEVEEGVAKLWGKRKLLDARTCLLAQVIDRLQIYIIRWNVILACPAIVNGIYQLLGDVDAKPVVPSVIKPSR